MTNVKMTVQGSKLVIEIDLTKEFGPSASGKSITVASTQGNKPVASPHGDIRVGLNVYKPVA